MHNKKQIFFSIQLFSIMIIYILIAVICTFVNLCVRFCFDVLNNGKKPEKNKVDRSKTIMKCFLITLTVIYV